MAFQGITQNLRWQMIDHSFPGKRKASQNKWLPWESLQASQVSQSYSGQSRPLKASAVFGSVVLLMVLALVLLLLTSAARVTILVQGVMGQRRRPCVAPSSPPLNGPADILILAGKTKILIHGKYVTLENKKYCYFNLCAFSSTRYSQTRCEVLCTRCCNVYNSDALQEAMKMPHSISHNMLLFRSGLRFLNSSKWAVWCLKMRYLSRPISGPVLELFVRSIQSNSYFQKAFSER